MRAFRLIVRGLRRLDDHWLGDLIGAASLFVMLWIFLFMGAFFQ